MVSRERILSNHEKLSESYTTRHDSVKKRIEQRRKSSAKMKRAFSESVASLNRLRNK